MTAVSTFIFDLDGTVIDDSLYARIYVPVLEALKAKLDLTDIRLNAAIVEVKRKTGRTGRVDTYDLCEHLGCLGLYYTLLEAAAKGDSRLNDGVLELFRRIGEMGKRIGIASNSHRHTIELYLKVHRLASFVGFVFSADDAPSDKRSLAYWQALIQKEGLVPSDCMVIGDDYENDVAVPKTLGMKTFLVEGAVTPDILSRI
ncbi:HAD family hydrolase [Candidatus Woesearchaeota archaeon]|nr:HAD family hydrolase [Candidatus Woesearchaeota archaeon]